MAQKKIIYLDNAASTRVDNRVIKIMNKFNSEVYGNPSSLHTLGERARNSVNDSREKIAKEINAKPSEIVFTSGATESNNLAIQGVALANPDKKKIVISSVEHASVYEVCNALKERGYEIVEIPTDKGGIIDIERLGRVFDMNTLVVSIIHVNNEIGVIQDLKRIGEICKKRGIYFHTDAAQSFGKLKIDVRECNIDLLSASSHKINGPKGIGFLYIKDGVKIRPIIVGGGQERGIRSGTENVPVIVGFAEAMGVQKKVNKEKIRKLRDKLIDRLIKLGAKLNGSREKRIYNNVNVSFEGIEADTLVLFLSQKGIMCSTGSACDERNKDDKRVLRSIGVNEKGINSSIRLVLNEEITQKDVDYVVKEIGKAVKRLRI